MTFLSLGSLGLDVTDVPLSRPHRKMWTGNSKITINTEIKVKLIPPKYYFAFAFGLILIGQTIFHIHVYIDTSHRILLSLSLS